MAAILPGRLFQSKGHFERPVQFLNFGASEGANEAGQLHLAETDEVVAQDRAFMFHAFVDTDRDLGGESVSASEDRGADDGGKSGIEQNLTAHDDEVTVEFRIIAGRIIRMMNAIDFASSHRRSLCLWVLIAKNVFDLWVQFVRGVIDEFEIASFDLSPRPFAEVLDEHGLDEGGARLLRSGEAIDAGEHVLGECDRGLLFHTTIILLLYHLRYSLKKHTPGLLESAV